MDERVNFIYEEFKKYYEGKQGLKISEEQRYHIKTQIASIRKDINTFLKQVEHKTFERDGLSFVTSIYHIYDNDRYLNQDYFGSLRNYIKVLKYLEYFLNINKLKLKKDFDFDYTKLDDYLEKDINKNILHNIYELNKFFTTDDIRYFFLNFGATKHATMIFLSKIDTNIIKAVYINTGEGFDENVANIEEHYFDIYKTIYFRKTDYHKFINFIKPFLFFRSIDLNLIYDINIILNYAILIACDEIIENEILKTEDIDIRIFDESASNYTHWAFKMYDLLQVKEENYKYINRFFTGDNNKYINDLSDEENSVIEYLPRDWNRIGFKKNAKMKIKAVLPGQQIVEVDDIQIQAKITKNGKIKFTTQRR